MSDTRRAEEAAGRVGPDRLSGPLAASAAVLCGLCVLAASGLFERPASADMTTSAGLSYRMLTTDGGPGEILAVIENRSEQIMVYTVDPSGGFELRDRRSLPEIFRAARVRAGLP
jgi:hypothetical protein